jgi:hypothetical protein
MLKLYLLETRHRDDLSAVLQATDCMLNLLGLVFPGWSGGGLKISYDKDDRCVVVHAQREHTSRHQTIGALPCVDA